MPPSSRPMHASAIRAGAEPARLFADRVFTMLFAVEAVLLAVALLFTPAVISLLAPGFRDDPHRFALAVELTRVTFPYLLLVSLVTLYGGILNALQRFASPAAAPILLNLSMMATLALAAFFPTAGHAAAWGVFIAGCLEATMVGADLAHRDGLPRFRELKLDDDVRRFFRALGPATLGSAGTQIALFADTIIASFLAAGAVSALYYADRLNQLPIGVIGIAIGTVLLPEMASRIAVGDEEGARHAQDRAIELTLLLVDPVPRRLHRGARPDHAGAVLPRRLHRRRCERGGRDARRLFDRPVAVRAFAQRVLVLSRPRRHRDARQGAARLGGDQCRLEDFADGSLCPGRARLRDLDRRVGEFCPADVVCRARRSSWGSMRASRRRWRSWRWPALPLPPPCCSRPRRSSGSRESLGTLRHVAALFALGVLGAIIYGGAIAAMFGTRWLKALRRRRTRSAT